VRLALIAAVIAAAAVLLFGRPRYQRWKVHRTQVAAASAGIRLAVLNRQFIDTTASGEPDDIHCVVMDWNLGGESVATLVAFADGATSLYLSSGGGVIGAGEHERVRRAATDFRAAAIRVRDQFRAEESFERPPSGHTRFFIVTRAHTYASPMIPNSQLRQNSHALAAVDAAAQATITEIRRST
jgi:hypothetical protein